MVKPSRHGPDQDRSELLRLRVSAAFFVVAVLLAGYLAWVSLRGGTVAGCGLESSCSRVLHTQWAYWLGIPVSLPALGCYVLLAIATFRRLAGHEGLFERWAHPLAAVVIAAALWFVILQIAVIRAFCGFCLTTHLSGVTASVLFLIGHPFRMRTQMVVALAGVALLIGGQFLRILPTSKISNVRAPVVEQADTSRILSLYDGRHKFDMRMVPRLGPAAAPHLAVSLFDYTCAHCRSLHELIGHALQRSEGKLAILALPAPLDAGCNPLVRMTSAENRDACQYARLALAVWESNPSAFMKFDAWLFAPPRPPPISEARLFAEQLVGADLLGKSLDGGWIKNQLAANIALFETNGKRAGSMQLPQLMVGESLSIGRMDSLENLLAMLKEQLGLVVQP